MVDRVILGQNGNDYGLWVKPPASSPVQFPHTLASTGDMLKVYAQGSVFSNSEIRSDFGGFTYWRHAIEVPYAQLPYIPLAFMSLMVNPDEPFSFPPDLYNLLTSSFIPTGNWGYVNHMPPIGIAHDKLLFRGWSTQQNTYLYYTVFMTKLRNKY